MFNLRIISPKGVYLDRNVESLTVKLNTGYRTILSSHAPLVGILDYGPMHIISDGDTEYYAIHGGAINIKDNHDVTLIVNSIESKNEIDIERAKIAKERAEKRLKEKKDNLDVLRAELAVKRALSRIETFNK